MRRTNLTSVPFASAAAPEPATQERTQTPRTVTQVRADFRNQVISGLREKPRRLSSVYFYDDQGSDLFDQITRLPEYYLTRAEREILETHAPAIGALIGPDACCVVDLGAGSGDKTQVILGSMREAKRDVRYAPVDVSAAALWSAEQSMQQR